MPKSKLITLTLHDTTIKGPVRDITAELPIDHEPSEAELWLLAKQVIASRFEDGMMVDNPEDNWDDEDFKVLTKRFENTENRFDVHPYNEVLPR